MHLTTYISQPNPNIMKILLKKHYLILLTVCICSCSSEKESQSTNELNELSIKATQFDPSTLELAQLIPLETSANNLMSNNLRIKMHEGQYYIIDMNDRNRIHHFGIDGQYLGAVATVGDGPKQVRDIQDFQINAEGQLLTLSSIGDQTTVFKFDETGSPDTLFQPGYLASAFTLLPEGNFLFSGSYNSPIVSSRIYQTTNQGDSVATYLPNDYTIMMMPMGERNFYESNGKILYTEIFNDTIYEVNQSGIKPFLKLNFEQYSLPSDFWKKDIMESFPVIQENGFAVLNGIFADENQTLINIRIQGGKGSFTRILWYDHNTQQTNYWDGDSNEENPFMLPIAVDDQGMTFITYQSALMTSLEDQLSAEQKSLLTEQSYDYPVIIKVKN